MVVSELFYILFFWFWDEDSLVWGLQSIIEIIPRKIKEKSSHESLFIYFLLGFFEPWGGG